MRNATMNEGGEIANHHSYPHDNVAIRPLGGSVSMSTGDLLKKHRYSIKVVLKVVSANWNAGC